MRIIVNSIILVLFFSCSNPSTNDLLLEEVPGENYSINYNKEFGLFLIKTNTGTDTVSLYDNWSYALYRYRQDKGQFSKEASYDEFLKSATYCLPGSEAYYEEVNTNPEAVFSSISEPTFCDCIQEDGTYNLTSVKCEEKFQIFRVAYVDSIQWYYNFYKDICNGQVKDTISFVAYKDSILTRAMRAEIKAKRIKAIQDSIDNRGPRRRCSAQVWIPKHQRSSSSRDYEQCRSYTGHTSGRCGMHR